MEDMFYYHALSPDYSPGDMIPEASAGRYAWLEYEKGKWYLLTNLFANVQESTRSWLTKQCALDELTGEGWMIVGAYPENQATAQTSCGEALGYGLQWSGHTFPNSAEKESRKSHYS